MLTAEVRTYAALWHTGGISPALDPHAAPLVGMLGLLHLLIITLRDLVVTNACAGEQTWPTEEELAAAAAAGGSKLRKRRLPAGTSEYQAAWILDDDEGSGSDGDDEEEGELLSSKSHSIHLCLVAPCCK